MNETRKTRVLFIAPQPFFEWRGSPIRIRFNLLALSRMGCEVELLTFPVGEDIEIPGVKIVRVKNRIGIRNVPIGPSAAKLFFDGELLWLAWKRMRRKKFDIVHTVEEAGAIGCVLTRLFGGRHVFEKHSDPVSHRGGMLKNAVLSLYDRVETVVIRRADAVIATGPGLRGQALQKSPESIVHAVSDIPSSLEEAKTDAVQKTRNAILQNGDEILVLYVGSFAAYQGIDLMFETAVRVIERCPRTRFVIIGGSDAEIGSRKKWLSGKHIRSHVTFTGKIPPDSLPEYLKAADILLSPRLHGVNTPLKLLDYLKSGRAIVAVDSEANRQILDDRSAVFAKPDVEAFAHSLCRVIEDAPLRDSLGKAARACYERRYTFEVFMRSLESVYRGAARLERDGSPSR